MMIYMPLLLCLGNPDLKERHWEKIFNLLNYSADLKKKEFSFKDLLDLQILNKIDGIEEISSQASGECLIEN